MRVSPPTPPLRHERALGAASMLHASYEAAAGGSTGRFDGWSRALPLFNVFTREPARVENPHASSDSPLVVAQTT